VNSAGSEVALHHDMMFGELAWSRVEVGQQRRDLPGPYGVKQGTFVLEFAGGPARVRLLDLAIEEKGLWKSLVKWKTWSREA
jgi:hypothetical protein